MKLAIYTFGRPMSKTRLDQIIISLNNLSDIAVKESTSKDIRDEFRPKLVISYPENMSGDDLIALGALIHSYEIME